MPIGLACCRWAGAAPFTAWAITIEIIEVSDTGHNPERPVSRCGHNTQMCLAFTTSVGIQGAKVALGPWVLSFYYRIKVTCRIALATKVVLWASLPFLPAYSKYAITCDKNNEKLQVQLSSTLYLLRFTLVTIDNTIINAVKAAASLVTDQSYQNIKLSQLRSISGILLASFLAISIIGNIL